MQLLSSSILLDLGKKFRFYVNCETNSKKQKKSSEYSDIKSKSVKSFAFLMVSNSIPSFRNYLPKLNTNDPEI